MSPLLAWLGFLLGIAAILIISRKNLAVSIFIGAIVLGVFTLPVDKMTRAFYRAFTDPSTILLAAVTALIPIIGETLRTSGQMNNLVNNLRIGKKAFLAVSPALIGMLPVPGGALLSAPLVEKGGKGVSREKKAGLNVWFRHVLFLIYPLTPALIVSAKVAELSIYQIILYLAPFLLFSVLLGYLFFLRDIKGKIGYEEEFSLKKLVQPLTVIFIAPVLDFLIKAFFSPSVEELATLIGVTGSLILAVAIGRVGTRKLGEIGVKSKPWNFALIIIGMMAFYNVFDASNIPDLIGGLYITAELLCVVVGFLLGFATGRIQSPALIIIPIFATKFGAMSPPIFAVTFFSIFLGYVLSPVHPCVSLTAEFFAVEIKDFLRVTAPPALIAFIICFFLLFSVNM